MLYILDNSEREKVLQRENPPFTSDSTKMASSGNKMASLCLFFNSTKQKVIEHWFPDELRHGLYLYYLRFTFVFYHYLHKNSVFSHLVFWVSLKLLF